MQFGAVTFMLAETILGKLRAKVTHHSIARDFRDHAGGSDTQTDAIAINDCCLWKWKWNDRQTVDQNVVGRFDQGLNCQTHGTVTGTQNINSVDLDGIHDPDSPSDFGIRNQFAIDLLAQFGRKLFRIIQPAMAEFLRKNHRGGNDWTR